MSFFSQRVADGHAPPTEATVLWIDSGGEQAICTLALRVVDDAGG